jgi:hypothetical protein
MGFPCKIFDRTKQLEEDFLNDIKGFFPLSHHSIGNPVNLLVI